MFETNDSPGPALRYSAMKILTRIATDEHQAGKMDEGAFLRKIKANFDFVNSLPQIFGQFEVQGLDGPHLCFALDLLGPEIDSFRQTTPNKALKPYIVKNIIVNVLEALVSLHRLKIVHTGALHCAGVQES